MHKKCGACDIFAAVFPERIGQALSVCTLVFDAELFELGLHIVFGCGEHVDAGLVFYLIHVFDNLPFACEIKGVSARGEFCFTKDVVGNFLIQHLGELHAIAVVGICPVEFHVGEFLQVFWARAFVAVRAADLESLRESGGHEALLPEFAD